MTQTMQDQFEQAFSDDNGKMPVAFIKLQRLGDSYSVPRVARAWYWFKRPRETLVVLNSVARSIIEKQRGISKEWVFHTTEPRCTV